MMKTFPKAAAALLLTIALLAARNDSRRAPSSPLAAEPPPSTAIDAIRANDSNRRLSEALPDGGCHLTWPVKPPPGVPITYAASYPGCGARMTWNLVEALTGLWTGDDWNNNGRGDEVITVKTHFPQSNGILPEFDERIGRAFIVIRNPMKSIPSFFNHIYEMRNHLPVHSERAPLEEWIKWRNAYLDTEIAEYKKFICYWMDRYSAENRLLMTYEGLTDDLIGPEVARGLNDFLGRVEGVTSIEPASVPCIWRAVVKNQPPPQQKAQIEKLQSLAVNAPGAVSEAQQQAQQQAREGGGGPAQVQLGGGQPMNPEQLPSGEAPQQLLSGAGTLTSPEAFVQQQGSGAGAPASPGAFPQQGSGAGALTSPEAFMQQQQQAPPPNGALTSPEAFMQQQQQAPPSNRALTSPEAFLQQQQQQHPPPNLPHLRRRLDPGHHDSQRKGPEVPRPYTPEQLDKMMGMLSEVAERYQKEDVRLYHIMMGYYEKIRGERIKLSPDELVKPPGGFY